MEKRKTNYFKIIMWTLIFMFLAVYLIGSSNYSENITSKNVTLTEDAIKAFEEDVRNNEVINLDSYITIDNKNYSNKITRMGEKINDMVLLFLSNGVSELSKIFSYLLT